MRTLIIEDDKGITECIHEYLRNAAGIVCDVEQYKSDAMHKISTIDYNLILLDINLPDSDGFTILKELRELKIDVPVIIISGSSLIDNKVKALSMADDYLCKPFSIKELYARMKAVTRRYSGFSDKTISCGNLTLNQTTGTVTLSCQEIELSKKEFVMLELFMMRQNSLIKKEVFLEHLYPTISDEPNNKIVDVLICKLRKKIREAAHKVQKEQKMIDLNDDLNKHNQSGSCNDVKIKHTENSSISLHQHESYNHSKTANDVTCQLNPIQVNNDHIANIKSRDDEDEYIDDNEESDDDANYPIIKTVWGRGYKIYNNSDKNDHNVEYSAKKLYEIV